MEYFEISAKTGSGIKEMFEQMANSLSMMNSS